MVEYRIRDRRVSLIPEESLVAVRKDSLSPKLAAKTVARAPEFDRAGWALLDAGEVPAESTGPRAQVFRRPGRDDYVLSLRRATVSLKPGASVEGLSGTFGSIGAKVIGKVPVGRATYTVSFDSNHDVFAGLDRLSELPDVEYAEPEFIEVIGPR